MPLDLEGEGLPYAGPDSTIPRDMSDELVTGIEEEITADLIAARASLRVQIVTLQAMSHEGFAIIEGWVRYRIALATARLAGTGADACKTMEDVASCRGEIAGLAWLLSLKATVETERDVQRSKVADLELQAEPRVEGES